MIIERQIIIMKNFGKYLNSKKTILLLSFLIPLCVALFGLVSGGFAPFGDKDLLTAGGYQSIIPYFHEFHDRFHNGTLFDYSIKTGLGYDFTTVITYYLSDPLNFLVLAFPKYAMLGILDILYIFKIGLAGLFFSLFLGYKNKTLKKRYNNDEKLNITPLLTLAFSVSYALSSAMISYGCNITYTTVFALLPLVLMGLDRIVNERRWLVYLISFSLCIICNFHLSIIVFIFTLFYLLMHEYEDTAQIVYTVLGKLFADILSIGLCAVIILNNLNSLFFKEDISLHFFNKGMFSSIWNVLKMSLTRSMPYQLSLDSYGVNIYVGIISLLLIIPFALNKKINLSYRIRNVVALVLLLTCGYSITSNYLFNGFYLTLNYRAFFSFIICFMLLDIGYITLVHISDMKVLIKGASLVFSLSIIISSLIKCTSYDESTPFIISLEFSVIYFVFLLMYDQPKISRSIVNSLVSVLMIGEIIFSFIPAISSLGSASVPYQNTIEANYENAVDTIKYAMPNARILVYDSIESHSTPLTYTVDGYDYIIASSDIEMDSYLIPAATMDSVTIYSNPYSLSTGFSIPEDISGYSYNSFYPYTSSNIFTKDILGGPEIFSEVFGEFISIMDPDNPNGSLMQFNISEPGEFYTNLSSKTYHYNNAPANEDFTIPYEASKLLLRETATGGEFRLFQEDALSTIYNSLKNSSTSQAITSSDHINSISIDELTGASYVLPIREASKWSGSSTLSSINIAGDELVLLNNANSDTITFIPKYFNYGYVISIIFLFITIAIYWLYYRVFVVDHKRFVRFAEKYDCQIILFIFSSVFFALIMMYNCCQPFGTRAAFASDGYSQYYPIVTNFFNKISHGDFHALNYQIGFGIDNFILSSGWLASPTTWGIALFSNPYSITAYTSIYYLCFILIPQCMYLYLTKRPKRSSNQSKLLVLTCTIAYSLSSYIISYFTFFLGMAYVIPLVLLATEHLLYNKKVVPYVIVMTFTMITSNYSAFLLCEFLVLFFFITDFESIKDFFGKGIRFALCSILSAGLSALFLIPFYMFTKMSPYKSGDILPSPGLENTMLKSLYDFQFLHQPDPVTHDDYRSNMYCGIIILLFMILFAINKTIKRSVRIRTIALMIFLYFSFGNPFMNFVLHGFHVQVMVPNRFSIFLTILMITAFIDTFANMGAISKKGIITAISIWAVILSALLIYVNKDSFELSFYSTIALIILYLILVITYTLGKFENGKLLILCLLIGEVTINAYLISMFSIGKDVSMNENVIEHVRNISDEYALGENNLVRTELLNFNMLNASSMTNLNSITYFSSISTRYQTDLARIYNTLTGSNCIEYGQGNPLANMFLSVKYFFTSIYNEYIDTPSYYKELVNEAGIKLYENELSLSPGIFFSLNNNPSEVLSLDEFALPAHNRISQCIIGKDIYDIKELKISDAAEVDDTITDVTLKEDTSSDSSSTLKIYIPKSVSGYVYLSYGDIMYFMGEAKEGSLDALEMDISEDFDIKEQISNIHIGILNIDVLTELYDMLSQHTMTDIAFGNNTIEGSIEAPEDGMVFLSIPAYETWEAYVDDVRIQCGQFMGGLGIPVTAGTHNIKLIYHTPGLKTGAIISIISLIIFILYLIIRKCTGKDKKKHVVEENEYYKIVEEE